MKNRARNTGGGGEGGAKGIRAKKRRKKKKLSQRIPFFGGEWEGGESTGFQSLGKMEGVSPCLKWMQCRYASSLAKLPAQRQGAGRGL